MGSQNDSSKEVTLQEKLSNNDWAHSIMNRARETMQKQSRPMTKVPWFLKEKQTLKEHFEPMLVSIGPYHHGHNRLQAMEELKPLIAEKFLKGQPIEPIFSQFDGEMRQRGVTEFYETEFDGKKVMDGEELIRMMFLDGCFVLHFIECDLVKQYTNSEIRTYRAFLRMDLFLMDNQLPFVVLDVLMSQFSGDEKMKKLAGIHEFVQQNTGAIIPPLGIPAKPPVHLLELLRAHLIGFPTEDVHITTSNVPTAPQSTKGLHELKRKPRHLIRCAKEMLEVGIQVSPSELSTLNQVKFKCNIITSELSLPPIIVDYSSKRKFLNLIAYEMCQERRSEFNVISYVCFLDSLIDTGEDVHALRMAGVLNNFLNSDEDVAEMVNTIAHTLVPDQAYANVQLHLQKHFQKRFSTKIAQVTNQHFTTPWSIVGFIAAVFAMFLTIVQTYFAAYPPGKDN